MQVPMSDAASESVTLDHGETAREWGSAAWAELQRRDLAPTPAAYEVWFTYLAGANIALTERMSRLLEHDAQITATLLDTLHREFIADRGLDIQAFHDGASEIQDAAHALADHVAGNQAALKGYGDTLSHWADHLAKDPTIGGLVGAIATLTTETTRASERNRTLEQQISSSAMRIAKLRQSLANVKQEATTDALTGIANRRAFDAKLKRNVTLARTEPSSLISVLLLDVDHFKQFNDSYGHRTGDLVLRLVARLLSDNIKGRDTVARYGGEEFAVLLAGADLKAAATVARQICVGLASKDLVVRGSRQAIGRVTISIGVAQFRPGDSVTNLVERADGALYKAKETGRNRVCTEADLPSLTLPPASGARAAD